MARAEPHGQIVTALTEPLLGGLLGDPKRTGDLAPGFALLAKPLYGSGDPVVHCSHLAGAFGDPVEVHLSGAHRLEVVADIPAAVEARGHVSRIVDEGGNVNGR